MRNYGIGCHIQKEQNEQSVLTKNKPVSANWWRDISSRYALRTHISLHVVIVA